MVVNQRSASYSKKGYYGAVVVVELVVDVLEEVLDVVDAVELVLAVLDVLLVVELVVDVVEWIRPGQIFAL